MSDSLIDAALAARAHAFAPYSKFPVGAAIEDSDGRIHTGCNVENATYGLTLCAERVAIFKAISEGVRQFGRVGGAADPYLFALPGAPFGQLLGEFWGEGNILLVNPGGKPETCR